MNSTPAKIPKALEKNEQTLHEVWQMEDACELEPEEVAKIQVILSQALTTLQESATIYHEAGHAQEAACCYLKMAKTTQRLGYHNREVQAIEKALELNRKGLAALDSVHYPLECLDGYLQLSECLAQLASQGIGDQIENYWLQAYAALQAAEFLAMKQRSRLKHALVRKAFTAVLEQSYFGDRDENLSDAIRYAKLAIRVLEDHCETYPVAVPLLYNYLGNCYQKVGIDRSKSIVFGRDAYQSGLELVDGENFPRLKITLENNLAFAKSVVENELTELPENEMVRRYSVQIKECVDNGDLVKAENCAWAFMQWGWSLPQSPNVHVAYAHNFLGNIYASLGHIDMAATHFYSAQVVLYGTVPPDHDYFKGIEDMREGFAQCLLKRGQSESYEHFIRQAQTALQDANAARDRGIQMVEKKLAESLTEFEKALALFPYDPVSLFYRANLRWQQQNFYFALRDFDLSITLLPKNVAARVNRGNLKLVLDDVQGAQTDFSSVLELQPGNTHALRGRAKSYAKEKQWQNAIEDTDELICSHPDDVDAYIMRHNYFKQLGKFDDAAKDLKHALSQATGQEKRKWLQKEIGLLEKQM